MMDYPAAWAFIRMYHPHPSDHDRKCSWVVSKGGILCDCHVINDECERRSREEIDVKVTTIPAKGGSHVFVTRPAQPQPPKDGARTDYPLDVHTMLQDLPSGIYAGANCYETDDEFVLHLWRAGAGGEGVDVRSRKQWPKKLAALQRVPAQEKPSKEQRQQQLIDRLYDVFTMTPKDIAAHFGDSRVTDDHARINYALELIADAVSDKPERVGGEG